MAAYLVEIGFGVALVSSEGADTPRFRLSLVVLLCMVAIGLAYGVVVWSIGDENLVRPGVAGMSLSVGYITVAIGMLWVLRKHRNIGSPDT